MLHGYGANKESFVRQIRFFSAFFRVIAVDMSGFGESPPLKYPYSVGDYAEEIKKVIDEIGERKIYVLAHSFGARVAVKLAGSDDRIEKIIFTGAAGLKPRRSVRYKVKRALFLLLKKFVNKEKLVKFYSENYRSLSPVMKESFIKIVNEDLKERYAAIKIPALLIFGDKDKETPLYMARKMNRLV